MSVYLCIYLWSGNKEKKFFLSFLAFFICCLFVCLCLPALCICLGVQLAVFILFFYRLFVGIYHSTHSFIVGKG